MPVTSKRPKLLIFSHLSNEVHATGAEKLLLVFAKELQRLFECALVVPKEGAVSRQARDVGLRTAVLGIPLCFAMKNGETRLERELEAMRRHPVWDRLIELLQRERPAYVWVNTCVHPLPAMAAKALGIPVIWALMETIEADSGRDGPGRPKAAAVISAYSDAIVGISLATLAPFGPESGLKKAIVLPPFRSPDDLEPANWLSSRSRLRRSNGWAEHHRVAGFVASMLHPQKGLKEFVQAMIPLALQDPELRLLIAGGAADDDAYVRSCLELARGAGLAHRFAWVRYTEQIESLYPALDLVVVPSLAEAGFGMPALEGMLFGKPVVAFASGGLTELMRATGNQDYLVAPGDIAGLTKAAAELLASEALRLEVGRRSMRMAQRVYGVEAFRERLDALRAVLPMPEEPLSGLVRGIGPTVYLLEKGRKRPFPSPRALIEGGFRFEDVRAIPNEKLALIPLGLPMDEPKPPDKRPKGRRKRPRRTKRGKRRAKRMNRRSGKLPKRARKRGASRKA
ncbi:glycosyltransferase family 4 protein [Cohnella laeviribosi]|uniref:glycosyltransferase family 4 protein n=1 Tax=Cohnella laeviribosi TaxID=380174 RepID=UPI003D1CA384